MTTEVDSDIDLYDSDVVKIERVVAALNRSRLTKSTTVDGWHSEIEQRFAEVGFKVNIVLSQIEGTQIGDGPVTPTEGTRIHTLISVQSRIKQIPVGEFDHEQQAYEVQHNIRGLKTEQPDTKVSVSMPSGTTISPGGLIVPK